MTSGLGLQATELRLGLPGAVVEGESAEKRRYEEIIDLKLQIQTPADAKETKNIFSLHSDKGNSNMKEDGEKLSNPMASFMKVRMDSPPYLHKVDPKMYKSYQELSMALQKMFGSFTNTASPLFSANALQFPWVKSGLTFAIPM
ncbi:hypothetical protein ZIOFF_074865 [Zingiber officinale]|uniref:Auxin-responsive protein n=1 Tax=Zingiber officinale TaxID=94328 RepID=A0A8J5ELA2_ZINOF|nr:hypothetical protein ZIOFF_074865 [Zingiber officinale]